jgi:hypothetical protein
MAALLTSRTGLWLDRWRRWRDAFEERIGPQVRQYWTLYRSFDEGNIHGPGQEWRDRTVIPTPFKIIETRVPRLVMSMFGRREWFHTEGRDEEDQEYEEMVRELMKASIEGIGKNDHHDGDFIKRNIDGIRYCQIVGHVFFKVWWRKEDRWRKTKLKDENGKWKSIELMENIYDNIDMTWLPLDSIAIDLSNSRKWIIERVQTSLEALQAENDAYKKETGDYLYKNLDLVEQAPNPVHRESHEEPRDTETWPLTEEYVDRDSAETEVELWLCWDNQENTLTKIANRSVELDHGYAPTPDGLDPYISVPAVPIPNRVYGESILNYVGPLAVYQTRIARARADEILLNIWQQFIYRQGSLTTTDMFWRPGGSIGIEGDMMPDRPVSDHVQVFPRRPVFQEAYTEEGYRQQQAEAVGGADAISQGVEATQKSRDVSASEIQQRTLQGANRDQLERLYWESTYVRPLLNKIFDLLRQNMTEEKTVRVLGKSMTVDLRSLERPVDIVVGGGIHEMSRAEQEKDFEQVMGLAQNELLGSRLKPEGVWELFFKLKDRGSWTHKLIKSDEEMQSELQAAQGAQAGALGPGSPSAPGQLPPPGPAAEGPGPGKASGPGGEREPGSPHGASEMVEYV